MNSNKINISSSTTSEGSNEIFTRRLRKFNVDIVADNCQ